MIKIDKSRGVEMDRQIALAIADVSTRTGVAEDSIRVVQALSVRWGSGAMGCPEEGKSYTQAIVPGLQVLLEADGKIHHYHGPDGGDLFHCPDDRVEAPAFGPGTDVM